MTETRSYPFAPSSVAAARHFVASQLEGQSEEITEAVTLIVSELATNAIRHAQTGFSIEIEVDRARLRVGITDQGGGQPLAGSPLVTDASGRGLQIVAHLAEQWGVTPSNSGLGKTVWFTVVLDGGNRPLQQVP